MKKIIIVFGTRPEAIKLIPVINAFLLYPSKFKIIICVTAQHRQMLDQVLELFNIVPHYDMDIMSNNQDLFDVTISILDNFKKILKAEQPDMIIVQGDTTTTFAASLAAFYFKIPIGHVEAGLRTYSKYQPFPEEKNRHMTTVIADYHFAPTEWARQNLLKEGISEDMIWVTGNTSIDALLEIVNKLKSTKIQEEMALFFLNQYGLIFNNSNDNAYKKIILVTGHRRENFGLGFKNICMALKEIGRKNPDIIIIYPVHLNPNVRKPVFEIFGYNENNLSHNIQNIYLIEPLDYIHFVYLMCNCYCILTDSGGIQEEALSLNKPILIMRDTTERPEGVNSGGAKLVGTDYDVIVNETQKILDDKDVYQKMSNIKNPYGDGKAASKIAKVIHDIEEI